MLAGSPPFDYSCDRTRRRPGTRATPIAFVVVGGLLTAVVTPGRAPAALSGVRGQVTLDTLTTLSALVASYLSLSRYRRQRLARDLIVCLSLSLLFLSNFGFCLVPGLSVGSALGRIPAAPIVAGSIAAGLFALAAFFGDRQVKDAFVSLLTAAICAGLLLFLSGLIGSMFSTRSTVALVWSDKFFMTTDRALFAVEIAGAVLFAVAALGWWRLGHYDKDTLAVAFAVASVVAAISRMNYALAASSSSPRIITASVFRLGFCVILLVGSATEIRGHVRQRAQSAVLEERRRIARDLHDGLAQELRYAATQSLRIGTPAGNAVAHFLDRALDESRWAIAALVRPIDEPFDAALTHVVEKVVPPFGPSVKLRLDAGIDFPLPVREQLLKITREAVANATRHAAASELEVWLSSRGGTTLTVSDNGKGFDPEELKHRTDCFGLVSMRERAEALGGEFGLESQPRKGTTVTVRIP
jgi:signal transduction histidine kinase